MLENLIIPMRYWVNLFILFLSLNVMVEPVALYAGPSEEAREPAVEDLFSQDYGKLLLEDTGYVLSSPSRWNEKDWSILGVNFSRCGDCGLSR